MSTLRRADRLLLGSPLRRRPYALVMIVVLAVALVFALIMTAQTIMNLEAAGARVLFLGISVSTIASLFPITLLWFMDRRERESPWLFLAAFLWGGFLATGLALPLNNAILKSVAAWLNENPAVAERLGPMGALLIGAPLAGPLVEEITKGIGVLALFVLLRAEFDNMRDGLIYGALIGIGFNWLEAPLYVAQGYAQFGMAPWGFQFGGRYALFGLGGHALYTGLFGAFLGLARQMRPSVWRYIVPLIGWFLGYLGHLVNNGLGLLLIGSGLVEAPNKPEPPPEMSFVDSFVSSSLRSLFLFLPLLAVLVVILWRSGRWERQVIREELADEVGQSLTAEEYAAIKRDGMFRTRRIDWLDRRRSAALINAQHELAFRKRRVRIAGGDLAHDPLVAAWRAEIARKRSTDGTDGTDEPD